jgi:membrane associated rhomboid family serine protease
MNNAYRPFSLFPPVVKNILIITVIVFIAQHVFESVYHKELSDYLGLHYFKSDLFKPHQFITYIFLHSTEGLSHILFNMLAVWMFGASLENYWGSKKFLSFYLLTGLGAALAQYFVFYFESKEIIDLINAYNLNPSDANLNVLINGTKLSNYFSYDAVEYNQFASKYNALSQTNPSNALLCASDYLEGFKSRYYDGMTIIGASGSLFGLLGAYGMLFPNNIINIYFFIPIKAKYFVILYGLIELFLGFQNSAGDNVAHFAHLGGLIVGVIIVLIWKKRY